MFLNDDLDMSEVIKEIQDQELSFDKLKSEIKECRKEIKFLSKLLENNQSFDLYQKEAMISANFKPIGHPSLVYFLECFKQVGIVAERVKKTFRDRDGVFDDETKMKIGESLDNIKKEFLPTFLKMNRPSFENKGTTLFYPLFGLFGEAGEIVEKLIKFVENPDLVMTEEERKALGFECSDLVWYITALAQELGFSLSEIAEMNLQKLRSRRERGVVRGEGDNR